jgi:hypothetical protein
VQQRLLLADNSCVQFNCKSQSANKRYHVIRLTLGYLWCAIALVVILGHSSKLTSQTTDDDQVGRSLHFDFAPFVGYRTSMNFPTEQNAQVSSPNLIFDAKPSYGITIGLRTNEEDLVEFRWARQDSRIHLEGTAALVSDQKVVLDQFLGDFTHEYILDNWPIWARPFVMGSVGATHLDGGTNSSFTRFTFGLGGGVKFFFNRHLGFRTQAEWLPLVVNPAVSVFCGAGCAVHINASIVSQGEFLVGPLFQF